MSRVEHAGRAEALSRVREHKDSEPVRLVLDLVRLRVEALKDELTTGDAARVPALQGAAIELMNLMTAITSRPAEKQGQDGAYA